jgi:beta-1,4-N-acetylglucosaminyltransferase
MEEITFTVIVSILLIAILGGILRLVQIAPFCKAGKHVGSETRNGTDGKKYEDILSSIEPKNKRIMILLGSGGHTGEMIRILEQWSIYAGKLDRDYVLSSGDDTSILKLKKFEEEVVKSNPEDYTIITVHRARDIGAGKVNAFINTLLSFASTFYKIIAMRLNKFPKIFLTNGPGTAIPIAYMLFICKYFGLCDTKIIYIESLARVNKLSLTGLLILPISDRFIVQWEPLARKYRRCEYYGILV